MHNIYGPYSFFTSRKNVLGTIAGEKVVDKIYINNAKVLRLVFLSRSNHSRYGALYSLIGKSNT